MSTKKFGIWSRTQERDLGWKLSFRNYYHTGHCSQKLPYIYESPKCLLKVDCSEVLVEWVWREAQESIIKCKLL